MLMEFFTMMSSQEHWRTSNCVWNTCICSLFNESDSFGFVFWKGIQIHLIMHQNVHPRIHNVSITYHILELRSNHFHKLQMHSLQMLRLKLKIALLSATSQWSASKRKRINQIESLKDTEFKSLYKNYYVNPID